MLRMGTRGLIERVADFEKHFPDSKISMHRVRKLYKELGIKQRVLRVEVALTPAQQRRQWESRSVGFSRVLEAYERREHLFFMDESVFSCGQVAPKIWFTPQPGHVFVPRKKLGFKAIAVAAAMNVRGEIVAWHIQDHSIDTEAFMEFLRHLKDHIGRKKAVLVLDNLGVHRTNKSQELARKFGIELVFNGTYSSEYMPIERLWAWAKLRFTRACADGAPYHN